MAITSTKSVLIAHSDPSLARTIEYALIDRGIAPTRISEGSNLLEIVSDMPSPVIFLEKDIPGASGMTVLDKIRERHRNHLVVMISNDHSAETALSAVRAGAVDYMTVPFGNNDLSACLDRLFGLAQDPDEPAENARHFSFSRIIGESPAIKKVFRLVEKVARTDSTVMIYGESGTGKELIARAIHHHSRRNQRTMIPVNCGAIPEELLESELFGHEKGSFTSAIRTRIGRFELADGGTIFLDEIADMSPKLQVKLLRVLQEHEFERIGGAKTISVNIRVITATNKDLQQAVEQGRFREDLYYRLNVIPINVPPLRERRSDIPMLVTHFLKQFQEKKCSTVVGISDDVMAKILNYTWPGNIRELENIIERMVILAEKDTLTMEDLPGRIRQAPQSPPQAGVPLEIPDEGLDFNQVVSDFENSLLMQALEKSGWVKNKAAQLLMLNRTTLVEKLKKKGIATPA